VGYHKSSSRGFWSSGSGSALRTEDNSHTIGTLALRMLKNNRLERAWAEGTRGFIIVIACWMVSIFG